MRITKFVHSCLLVESPQTTVLIDAGNFTWSSRLLAVDKLPQLDAILYTHEHADHYDGHGLRKISRRFPHAAIITNEDLAEKIYELKLPNAIHAGSFENLKIFKAEHEPLPLGLPNVTNIGVHIADKLTHSGDSLALEHTREFLALPVAAPFASFRQALDTAVRLKPKAVIPLHDWEWHKEARQSRYALAKKLLGKHGIEFISLNNAEPVEI
ncbi:MAG TPA: MBL fold metallo-hydrolase [Candidatus Saccharimonadales bacterium]|nr:MBL fold metallo-hydrolase [Candidatus Saccharimonadales bacterium]